MAERRQLSLVDDTAKPSRDVRLDWLSVTARFDDDRCVSRLKDAVTTAVLEHFGYRDSQDEEHNGNYLEGVRFKRAGIHLRWTTFTACKLLGASEDGRCAGTMNLIASGKSGIGQLELTRALSFWKTLIDVGFGSAGRVDLAVDVFDLPGCHPSDIYSGLASGRFRVPRRQTCNIIGEFKQGSQTFESPTVYVGNLKSENFARVYDRAAVLQEDRLITRFERQTRSRFAQSLLESFQGAADSAFERSDPEPVLRAWALGAVKATCDFRATGHFKPGELPSNWANRSDPAWFMKHVFEATAPLQIGEVVLKGGFASGMRSMQKNWGRILALHAVQLQVTQGSCPDELLSLCGDRMNSLGEEDFLDLVQSVQGITVLAAREAAVKLEGQWFAMGGTPALQIVDPAIEEAKAVAAVSRGCSNTPLELTKPSQRAKKAR